MTTQAAMPRGARMLILAQLSKAVVLLLGIVVLSRLLDPREFGLVAVPIAIVGVGELLRDMGLSTAATTTPDLSSRLRDLLFWLNCGLAMLLVGVTLLITQLLAGLFDSPALGEILPWLSVVFLLNGVGAQYRADLNREMRFNAMAAVDSSAALVGVLGAIALALSGVGYWALVAQPIIVAAVSTAMLVALGRWIPKLPRRAEGARKLIGFGMSVSWSQVLMYAGNNVDTLALGYWGSPTQLGYYSRSFQIAVQPLTLLKAPATAVALPLLSRRRDNAAGFERAVATGLKLIAYTIVPVALALAACAPPVVRLFLGPAWEPVIPMVALLAAAAAIQQYASVASWMFLAANLGRDLRRYSLASLLIKVLFVIVAAPYGPLSVAAAFLVSSAISSPIVIVWASRATRVSVRRLVLRTAIPIAIAVIAAGVAAAICYGLPLHALAQLSLAVCGFVTIYGLAYLVPAARRDMKDVIRLLLRRGRGEDGSTPQSSN